MTKNLPSSVEIEQVVLATIMRLGNSHIDTARPMLEVDDFSLHKHQTIWRRVCVLYDSGKPTDRVSVCEDLSAQGELAAVGGVSYIAGLDDGVPEFSTIEGHLQRLRESRLRRRMIFAAENLSARAADETESADDVLAAFASTLTELSKGSDDSRRPISTREMIDSIGLNVLLEPRKHNGLRLPGERLDNALSGLGPGQMIILMAETSRGKTSLALQIASCAALQGHVPAMWTMEMSPRSLFRRLTSQLSGTQLSRNLRFDDRSAVLDAATRLGEDPIYFDSHSRNVGSFIASLRQIRSRERLGLAVVDYLQLIRGNGRNRAQEVSDNSRALKLAAMDMQIPFVVLSQVDRNSVKGDGKIGLHSAKESGDIENDADVVMWIDGGELSKEQDTPVSLHIGKQREGPAGFSIPMVFRPTSQSFMEVSE